MLTVHTRIPGSLSFTRSLPPCTRALVILLHLLLLLRDRACTPRLHKLLSLHHSVGQHSGGRKSVQGLKPDRSSQRGGDRPIPSIERDHRRPRRKRRGKFLFYPMPTPSTAVLPFSARLCPRSPPSVAPCSSTLDTSRTRHRVTARFLLLHHSFLSFAFFHQKSPKFQERKFLLSLSLSLSFLSSPSREGEEERKGRGKGKRFV